MDAVVVYESLWGNTAAIAHAIAEGLGDGARALTTSEATPEVVAAAKLVIAGAPVHGMSLPSESSRDSARRKPQGAEHLPADLTQLPMRDWLAAFPRGTQLGAAFETRVKGPLGRGAAKAIARGLESKGVALLDGPRGFTVHLKTDSSHPAALLLDGQVEDARAWGRELRQKAVARL